MKVAIASLLLPALAHAEPRSFEAMPLVGISLTAPTAAWSFDSDAFDLPKSPVLGVALAWERDPFTNPVRSRETWRDRLCWLVTCDIHLAPELKLLRTRGRTIASVALRFEWVYAKEPEEPTKPPIIRAIYAPRIGVLDDGHTTVYGFDYTDAWMFDRRVGFAWSWGVSFWRERTWVAQVTSSLGVLAYF